MVLEIILAFSTVSVMLCAIWGHLYNLINVKNAHRRVLLLVAGFTVQYY